MGLKNNPLHRRLALIGLALPLLLIVLALFYRAGMQVFEGQPRTFWQALVWASGTVSTTGYGGDTTWNHPVMVLFAVFTQFAGVFLVFFVVPLILVPVLEERFEKRLPRTIDPLAGHLVVFRHGPEVEALIAEAERAGVAVLLIEDRESEARSLIDRGRQVLYGSLEENVLENAHLGAARGLIANGGDDQNAVVVLTARQLGFAGELVALLENPLHRQPLILAGANAAATPKHLLAAALAARASERVSPTISGLEDLGERLRVRELRVASHCEVAGQTLAQSRLGARCGAAILARWHLGRMDAAISPDEVLAPRDVLIAAGSEESLGRLAAILGGESLRDRAGRFVVAGYGEVGRVAVEILRGAGEDVLVVDRQAGTGVDVVGNFLEPAILERVDPHRAKGVLLALDTDSATLFAAMLVREAAPDVPIVARVNHDANVGRIHQAGADFALSLSQAAGRILAARLFRQEAVEIGAELRVVSIATQALAGRTAGELDLPERFACSVVAVERAGEVLTGLDADFRLEPADRLFVCGSRAATQRCQKAFP